MSHAVTTAALPLILAGLAMGCGDGAVLADAGGGDSAASVDTMPPADAQPAADGNWPRGPLRGQVEVVEVSAPFGPWGHVHGGVLATPTRYLHFVFYGNIAVAHWQQPTMHAGDCRLLQIVPAYCTSCDGICVDTEICEPYPEMVSVGDLAFDGLSVPLTLQPSGISNWYMSQNQVPAEAFSDDAVVTMNSSGGTFAPFSVATAGVPPLIAGITDDEIELSDGSDYQLTWTPSAAGARVRLTLNANNQGHGNPYEAIIECDTADTGAVTVPAALIEAFPTTERWEACEGSDCPLSRLTRYRRSTVEVEGGDVALIVGSEVQFYVLHE